MQRNPIPQVVLAAALSACSLQPELLNSERIERSFGSYGIEVLSQNSAVRRSNLYSSSRGSRTCRTYAVVEFVDPAAIELAAEHQAVLAGQSIGSTFQNSGWRIEKVNSYIGNLQLPNTDHPVAELMKLNSEAILGVHAYQLVLHKGAVAVHYATIVETHHPDYLDAAELRDIYPLDATSEIGTDGALRLVQLVLQTSTNAD